MPGATDPLFLATPVDLRQLRGYDGRQLLRGLALAALAAALMAWCGWHRALDLFVLLLGAYLPLYLLLAAASRWPPRRLSLLALAIGLVLLAAASAVLAVWLQAQLGARLQVATVLPRGWAQALAAGFALAMVLPELWQQHRRQVELRWLQERETRAVLEKSLLEAELRALQAQVEPHFLYNTLATVQYLIRHQPEQAERMLGHFVGYLRNALPQWNAPLSTLGRECRLAQDYLAIMAIRMGGRLQYAVHCPPQLAVLEFPPLMLISLVENAVRHGIEPRPGPGRIEIEALQATDGVSLQVRDDGVGLRADGSGSGVGLANIRRRLAALHGNRASLQLAGNAQGGLDAILRVPLP